jgi:uncharacterized membrane protein (DUF4010 family)
VAESTLQGRFSICIPEPVENVFIRIDSGGMPDRDLVALLISASLGALIGLERQWGDQEKFDGELQARAGVRTHVLWAVLGTLSALVANTYAPGFFLVGFAGMLVILGTSAFIERDHKTQLGLTSLTAALLTFFAGALVYWGERRLALVLAVSLILLLATKRSIHRFSRNFEQKDVHSALQFLAISGIVLPLAPNEPYGPYDAFNPFHIWLMVVLVTGLAFAGYVAIRTMGPGRGLGTIGFLGGVVSSTATTLTFSRQSRSQPEISQALAMAILVASVIMPVRVAILSGVVNIGLLDRLWPWLLLISVPAILVAGWLFRLQSDSSDGTDSLDLKNPMSLRFALAFAAAFGIVIFLSKFAQAEFGESGVTVVAFLSGLTSMDAVALTYGKMASDGLAMDSAAQAVLAGCASNTLLKAGIALGFGSRELRRPIIIAFSATFAASIAAWILV